MAAIEPVYISYLNYIGSGAPADGDQITSDNSQYPLNTVYTDRVSGIRYVRKATTKVAATDWQSDTSGGTASPNARNIDFTSTLTEFSISVDSVPQGTWTRGSRSGSDFVITPYDSAIFILLKTPDLDLNVFETDVITINSATEPSFGEVYRRLVTEVVFTGAGNDLQSIIDNGATLTHSNSIDVGGEGFQMYAGDNAAAYTEQFIAPNRAQYYKQSADGNDYAYAGVQDNAGAQVARLGAGNATDFTELIVKPAGVSIDGTLGVSGTFTTQDGKTVTVVKGIVTSIV